MKQPDAQWRKEVEQQLCPLMDCYLYQKQLPTLKAHHQLRKFHRHLDQSRYGTGNQIQCILNKTTYNLTEFFILSDEEYAYLEVAYDCIKPWPRQRQYYYLFEQQADNGDMMILLLPRFRKDCLFQKVAQKDIEAIEYYVMRYQQLQTVLQRCHITQEALYKADKQLYRGRQHQQKIADYTMIIEKSWRSRPTYLKLPKALLNEEALDKGILIIEE